jgi:excisionase family DNA binding protein
MTEELMTMKEVMDYLKVSKSTVLRMVADGKLNPVRISHKVVRYTKANIDELIEAGKATGVK